MKTTAQENLFQLKDLINVIGIKHYNKESSVLSGATIGQHIGHILEFYLLLVSSSFTGTISYDKRERDLRIETDPDFAAKVIDRLLSGINTLDETQRIKFEGDYSSNGSA